MVILVCAKMFPSITLPVPIDTEAADVHHTSQGEPLFITTTDAPGPAAVVSEVARKM
jgi:hypothetical protein